MIYAQASIAKMIADKISTTTTISHVLVKVPTGWRIMPAAMAPAGLAVKAAYEPPKPKHKGKGKPTTIGLDMGGQDDGVGSPQMKAHNYLIQAAQAEVAQEKAAKEGLAKAVQAAQAKVATQKLMHEKWLKEHPGAATPTEAHSKYVEHLKQKAITDEPLITKWDPLASEFVSAEEIKKMAFSFMKDHKK